MPGWGELSRIASELAGEAHRVVDRALGKTGAYRAIGYRGYGTSDRALVLGRVLEHTRIASADAKTTVRRTYTSSEKSKVGTQQSDGEVRKGRSWRGGSPPSRRTRR